MGGADAGIVLNRVDCNRQQPHKTQDMSLRRGSDDLAHIFHTFSRRKREEWCQDWSNRRFADETV